MPSEAEGFGLPLIEAACHGTPIIARDIPIFREVGGSGVFYFNSKNGGELAAALGDWLAKMAKNEFPRPESIKVLSWREAAAHLLDATQAKGRITVRAPKSIIQIKALGGIEPTLI